MKPFFRSFWGAFAGTLAALALLVFLTVQLVGALAAAGSTEPSSPKNAILKIDFESPFAEQSSEEFTFDLMSGTPYMGKSISILDAVRAIDAAAADPAIKFIYMTPGSSSNMTVAQAEEIREALGRFRASGKAIVSYSKTVSTGLYYVASVADKVILNTYADCLFSGMSTTVLYYKDLIDKLGIDVQLIRHGKYKSAGEPYIASQISEANREQYSVMLNSIWNTLSEGIAEYRSFTQEEFCQMVDGLKIVSPEDALKAGLVDELWFDDQVEDYLCSLFGVSKPKKLKYVSLEDYISSNVKSDMKVKDKVAVIYADGEIQMGESQNGILGDDFAKTVAKVRRDSTVKAVVFRVNSPGGSVQASAIIAREIELLKEAKPVIASYGDYAASGGYWISCGCDKIFSDKMTLTGSIGVFGIIPSVGRALSKNFHINAFEVSTNSHGSMTDLIHPLDKEEEAWMQQNIENVYTDFVSRVSAGRGIPFDAVDSIGQGRVWTGRDAVAIGLVDETGTLSQAVNYAATAVGLEKYRIVEYPATKDFYEKFMESVSKSAGGEESEIPVDMLKKAYSRILDVDKPEVMARMENISIR